MVKKGDMFLVTILLAVVVSILVSNQVISSAAGSVQGATKAVISLDGEVYQTIDLSGQTELIEIRTERGYDLLKVHDNGIEVIKSDCPEKICISMGFINRIGQTIICLPNRMIVEIIGDDLREQEVDALST